MMENNNKDLMLLEVTYYIIISTWIPIVLNNSAFAVTFLATALFNYERPKFFNIGKTLE